MEIGDEVETTSEYQTRKLNEKGFRGYIYARGEIINIEDDKVTICITHESEGKERLGTFFIDDLINIR